LLEAQQTKKQGNPCIISLLNRLLQTLLLFELPFLLLCGKAARTIFVQTREFYE